MGSPEHTNTGRQTGQVKTTVVTFTILEAVKELDGGRVSEIADHLGMTKSKVHRHLSTLVEEEYLVRDGDLYRLGLRFLDLGEHSRNAKPDYRLAKEQVEKLAESTNERAQFIVEEHGYGVYVHRQIGSNAVETGSRVGKRIPLHATSAGKAILAELPQERVETIIVRHGLHGVTKHTVTDQDDLYEELDVIRSQGYATNEEENILGLYAIGVPIVRPNGMLLGALSISGPVNRLKNESTDNILTDLLGAANELELNIEYK